VDYLCVFYGFFRMIFHSSLFNMKGSNEQNIRPIDEGLDTAVSLQISFKYNRWSIFSEQVTYLVNFFTIDHLFWWFFNELQQHLNFHGLLWFFAHDFFSYWTDGIKKSFQNHNHSGSNNCKILLVYYSTILL
jgi:hypothetical protein